MTAEPSPEVPFEAAAAAAAAADQAAPSPAPKSPAAALAAIGIPLAEAEVSLLGCCLIDESFTADLCLSRGITPDSFAQASNRLIWEAITDLRRTQEPADAAVIAARLQSVGKLTPDLAREIFALMSTAATTIAVPSLIDSVLQMQRRREAIQHARRLIAAAEDPTSEIDLALADAQRRITPPAARSAHPYQLWTPSQFIAHTPDPSACLLGDGYIERGEWTSLIGVGGLGKTRLALHFAICQITGREFCGIPTRGEPQHTIILSTENGLRRWKADLEKFYTPLGERDRALLESHLRIQALTAADDADLNLGIPDTVTRLHATLSSAPPAGLVIFDPFADMVDGDENKTTDLVTTLQTLRRLTGSACPEAAILIIHHARTGSGNVAQAGDNYNAGNFGRGSKALFSKVRCELQLAPQDRDDPARLVLACGKANNTAKFVTRGLVFDPETFAYSVDSAFDVDEWREDVAGRRKKAAFSVKELVEIVAENQTHSGAEVTFARILEVSSAEGVSRATICRVLKQALDGSYLRKGKCRGMWALGSKPISHI